MKRTALFLSIALAAAAAGTSVSASERLSDQDYLQLARCIGWTQGADEDAAPLQEKLREATRGRTGAIRDRANTRRRDASVQMRMSKDEARVALQAERTKRCAAFV